MSSINQSVAEGEDFPASTPATQGERLAVPQRPVVPSFPKAAKPTGMAPAGLVLLLAFFLASTPARNSDFWLHLATGKALTQGHYQFGVEPFTSAEPSAYWTNPSWLYDLVCFFLYQTLGGTVLVLLKALLIVVVAWLMIAMGKTANSLFLASFATGLTLVAMGPWLALKPLCLSFFFLAWTVWYLEERLGQLAKPLSVASAWPLLVVFALWSNLDRWFFLGPLVVGFYCLGSILPGKAENRDKGKALAGLFVAGLAVCLVNPHHFHVWAVPWRLLPFGSSSLLDQDPLLRSLVAPFHDSYFTLLFFRNPPALAFWSLAFLSLLSFCLDFGSWPIRWLLAWSFFFFFSLLQTQAIPFFAIVAGPILARNLGSYFSQPQARWYGHLLIGPGRGLSFVVATVLAVTAWPGWLQLGPYGPRAWGVELDPGIKAIGQQMAQWHAQGKTVALGTAFPFNLDASNYLAWFCPEIPCWTNGHLHLSEQAEGDFLALREALMGVKLPGTPERNTRQILRDNQVSLLVVYGSDPGSLTALKNLFPPFHKCPLLAFTGKAAVFARPELAPKAEPPADLKLDLAKEAFSFPNPVSAITSPGREPIPMRWWEAFWRPHYTPSVDRDEALALLTFFEASMPDQTRKLNDLGKCKIMGELVFSGGMPTPTNLPGVLQATMNLNLKSPMSERLMSAFLQGQDDGPMETLYLALRACRRALQANPNDSQAFFLLGETYYRLGRHTREAAWTAALADFRRGQLLGAYQQCLKFNPQNLHAHERLAEVFKIMGHRDLTLQHLRKAFKIRAGAAALGESREQLKDRLGQLKNTIQTLDQEVQSLQDRLTVNSENMRVVDRANLAAQYGLSGTALSILLKSNIAAFGTKGLELELNLLLNTGQAETAENWLDPKHEKLLGVRSYWLIKARVEAAIGNYQEARKGLENMMLEQGPGGKKVRAIDHLATRIGNALLFEASGGPLKMLPLPQVNFMASKDLLPVHLRIGLTQMDLEASSLVLGGMMAIEAGDNQKASAYFRQAQAFWNSPAGVSFTGERSLVGRQMTEYFLHQLEKANR